MEELWKGNSTIFRGYVKGEGKKSVESHKGKELRSFESASVFDSFGAELNEGFIDISFDTKEEFEAFLNMAEENEWCCLAIQSEHGGHSFWKNTPEGLKNGKEISVAVGFTTDIHSGATYIPLRVNGVDRKVMYDILDGEEYQEVPPELLPIKTQVKLWGMKEHSGRNEDMSKVVFAICGQLKLDDAITKRIITNANRFVLSDPLPESQLETILRDETFENARTMKPNFFSSNGKFLIADFSEYLIEHYNLKLVNGVLCVYSDGIYQADRKAVEEIIRKEIRNISPSKRKEVIQELYVACDDVEPSNARYIGFKNGILDITEMKLLPFNPDMVVTNCIPWNYNANAYNKDVDMMLDRISCNDEAIRQLLEECVGYCFYRKNIFKKAFIFTGNGNNGKSTFLDCIVRVVGDANVSALDLKELNDRFSTAMLHNKLLNAGDDISDDFIQDSSLFKKIVSGDRIKGEKKGEDPFDFNPYVKLIFCVNSMPRIKDKTGAVKNRLIPIPFEARFSEDDSNYDPNIRYKLRSVEAMEYLVVIGVQGLKRLLDANRFTKSEKVDKELGDYELYNNPVLGFVFDLEEANGEGALLRDTAVNIYAQYQVYCNENGFQPESRAQFGRSMKMRFDLETVPRKMNGKSIRVFRKCERNV